MCRILLEQKSQNWTRREAEEQPSARATPAVHTGQGLGQRRRQLSAGLQLCSAFPEPALVVSQPRILSARQPGRGWSEGGWRRAALCPGLSWARGGGSQLLSPLAEAGAATAASGRSERASGEKKEPAAEGRARSPSPGQG